MRMLKSFPTAFIALFFITLSIACVKESIDLRKIDQETVNFSIAVPLIDADIKAVDFLNREELSDMISVDSDGLISIIYEGELLRMNADQLFKIENQLHQQQYQLDAQERIDLPIQGIVSKDLSSSFTLDIGNDSPELHSVEFKSGVLTFSVSSSLQHNIQLSVSINQLIDENQNPVNFQINLTPNGSTASSIMQFDLSGYQLDVLSSGSLNTIDLSVNATLISTGAPINGNESIDIEFDMQNLQFLEVIGKFGQITNSLERDSLALTLFDRENGGEIWLKDPEFELIFTNSFGIPIGVDIPELFTRDFSSNQEVSILFNNFPMPVIIDRPAPGTDSIVTSVLVDNSNSNINEIIKPTPKYLVYKADAATNPNDANAINSIHCDDFLKISSKLKLPLQGYAKNWDFRDTFDINTNEEPDIPEDVSQVLIRIDIINGFPFDAQIQLYTYDENEVVLDSLLGDMNYLFKSALVGTNGEVTETTSQLTDIILTHERKDKFLQAKKLELHAIGETFEASEDPSKQIKITDKNFLTVRIGVKADAKLPIN